MVFHLKTKLIIVFTAIILMTGISTAIIGTFLISKGIMNQVENEVKTDLNLAREIWNQRVSTIKNTIYFATLRDCIKDTILHDDRDSLRKCLEQVRQAGNMEIASITDKNGVVLTRVRNREYFGDDQKKDLMIRNVLKNKNIVASPVIISCGELVKEGADLAKRICFPLGSNPGEIQEKSLRESFVMMLMVAAPIWGSNGDFIGVLYGGDVVNKNYHLLDKIKNAVFHGEKYRGKDMGSVTISQKDMCIATNVLTHAGERAVGMQMFEKAYNKVLEEGKKYIGRALVYNTWYVTAYEPIRDVDEKIIGMLGVGLLEQKFVDMRRKTLLIFFAITIAGMIIVLVVSNFFAQTITKPLHYMVDVARKISGGDFSEKVSVDSQDELGELENAFNSMITALEERDEELKKRTQQQLMRSEKLAALGRMAAGIAHEVNNPLTSVLMYSHIMVKKLPEKSELWDDANIIASETTRCRELLKNLLNFSREDVPEKKLFDINVLIGEVISIIQNHVYFEKAEIMKELSSDIPKIMADANQIEQVFMNLFLNAVEAMSNGGKLIVKARFDHYGNNVVINVEDTGCGISKKEIDKIFDPFYTTKEMGEGTGLGLAVSYGIIQRHDGYISVESEVGAGTTFTITLPVGSDDVVSIGSTQ